MIPTMHYDLSLLNNFVTGLGEAKQYQVKVGILGSKVNRKDGSKGGTNAEIGARHEWGSFTERIPQRSFLRMPLFSKGKQIIELTQKAGRQQLWEGKMKLFLQKLGVACEQIIGEAFASGGYGQWKPLAESTIEMKGHARILIHTRQLERAITSAVVKK